MNKIIIFIAALIVCQMSLAEDEQAKVKKARWYQVNFTLFQQKADLKLDESFKFTPLPLDMADIIELKNDEAFALSNSGMNATLALHHENTNNLAFTEQTIDQDWAEKMSKLDPVNQPILYNVQWQQPVYEQAHSLPIYFESSQLHLGTAQVKGLFHLHVSRYLHSTIDLQFLPSRAVSTSEVISFEQSSRMRSKEMHYLDHPLLGAIIRIIPVEHPLEKVEVETQESPEDKQTPSLNSALNIRL